MKISAGLLGVALGQGSGDSDDYTYTYDTVDAGAAEKSDGYNNGYNSGYNFNEASYSSDPYNQGYYGRSAVGAYELSCWNSNSMRDFNHDNKFAGPGENIIGGTKGGLHHQYGYENTYVPGTKDETMEYGSDTNLYGSIEDNMHIDIGDDGHSVDAVSPHKWGYQNSNPDAKYHYGHHVKDATANRGYGPNAATAYHGFVADDWRYSLRHSGCLYEVKDYTYDAASYAVTSTLAWDAGSSTAHPHWVHVFNAHIYPHSANTIKTFHVVMANPVYEGLGYFNFVATYADTEINTASNSFAQDPFASTYAKAARYSEAKGSWALTETATSWKLVVAADADAPTFAATGAVAGGVAISSFPHNQLGADFRFNLRTLHTMGHGLQDASLSNTADSYFWYAVDTITITFPHYVSETDSCHGLRSGPVPDPDTVDCTGHVHDIIVDENIEITSVTGGNQGSPTTRLSAAISGGCGATPFQYGPSKTINYQCAHFCKNGEITCGKTLTISNIMSTYDEFHLRQYGTIQEIWAQLQYAYTQTVDESDAGPTGFESPMPNVFFSAAQVNSIVLACNGGTDEKCKGYTRAQNMPYAGDSTGTSRWTNSGISNGDARGDAFWVNNNDNKA